MSCVLNGASHFKFICTVDHHIAGVRPSFGLVLPAMHDKLLILKMGAS